LNLIHLSERKNRNSILSKGLIPTTIKLEHHLDYFNRYGMISGNKAVYTWLDSEKNEKFTIIAHFDCDGAGGPLLLKHCFGEQITKVSPCGYGKLDAVITKNSCKNCI
jgi:hypothetical protein